MPIEDTLQDIRHQVHAYSVTLPQLKDFPVAQTSKVFAAVKTLLLARTLLRRVGEHNRGFEAIAAILQDLIKTLKHLLVEVESLDSLLYYPLQISRAYARQLTAVVEDCDFTLDQLESILDDYESFDYKDLPHSTLPLIHTRLSNQKTNIDIWLDTVQLHKPATSQMSISLTDNQQLDRIKDKVDAIALLLVHQLDADQVDTEEALWQQFCNKLVETGFSAEVLQHNKVNDHLC